MKTRFDLIQYLINTFNYTTYLELGCRMAENNILSINYIKCQHKDSVDINKNGNNYVMSTDEFFKGPGISKKYDIIFVDADHDKESVRKDILNSLDHLNDNGCVVCHDISPPTEAYLAQRYCNNAWETWALFRSTRSDLEMYATLVDIVGVGVIRKGQQTLYDKEIEYSWDYLNSHRNELLNIVDIETLKSIFEK